MEALFTITGVVIVGLMGWLCVWTIRRNVWAGVILTLGLFTTFMMLGILGRH